MSKTYEDIDEIKEYLKQSGRLIAFQFGELEYFNLYPNRNFTKFKLLNDRTDKDLTLRQLDYLGNKVLYPIDYVCKRRNLKNVTKAEHDLYFSYYAPAFDRSLIRTLPRDFIKADSEGWNSIVQCIENARIIADYIKQPVYDKLTICKGRPLWLV